ncbi:hypothetical protein TSUD_57820 [Trifolium subterraneum]|uniref:Zinc-finger domain-containing protein n=1 Tax=Trifolium subterraneum TaxID=3900 RepID=A0A2Z6MEV7_TRISU|nr:hypothetical protein TSUD_57820 [Trifolium subterraneum]
MTLPPVDYGLKCPRAHNQQHSSSSKKKMEVEIYIPEGTNPEVYAEQHEKLLGDCETAWELYGENVREADLNPKWTCPCCREIRNCNSCRRKNGWMPTGSIYNKVMKLGFKSVAHYLIKTHRSEESMEGSSVENIIAQEIPETTLDTTQKGPTRTRRALRS